VSPRRLLAQARRGKSDKERIAVLECAREEIQERRKKSERETFCSTFYALGFHIHSWSPPIITIFMFLETILLFPWLKTLLPFDGF
jgi:hypothetical protein